MRKETDIRVIISQEGSIQADFLTEERLRAESGLASEGGIPAGAGAAGLLTAAG